MESYYPLPAERRGELCSGECIDRLQERFAFFGEYYEAAKVRWQAVLRDDLRKTWVDVCSLFVIDYDFEDIVHLPIPEPNGTPAGDMMMLFILAPSVEAAYAKYLERGFDADFALNIVQRFHPILHHTSVNVVGRPAWIGKYFYWCVLYIKARLFFSHGFNFELHRFRLAYILRNKATGELLPLSVGQEVHPSGLVLGSAGVENKFFIFGKTTLACVYRVADLYGYDYETESSRDSEGKEITKHFCTFLFRNTTGMYAPRIELSSASDYASIEKYFNELFGIQKTLRNSINNAKRQVNAIKAFAGAFKDAKDGTLNEETAAETLDAMDASVYGDRTQWIAKADAALAPYKE